MAKKKKNSAFDDILGTTKLTLGVGIASHTASAMNSINPVPVAQKNIQTGIGMLGIIPAAKASKNVLDALEDWDSIDF